MRQIENVVSDRGSKYAVSGGAVQGRRGCDAFIADLKRVKKYAKATHNSWPASCRTRGPCGRTTGKAAPVR